MITGSDRRCRVEYAFLLMFVTSLCHCIAYLLQWKMTSSGAFVHFVCVSLIRYCTGHPSSQHNIQGLNIHSPVPILLLEANDPPKKSGP